ncbi:MAG: DUF547 domain-containing protein [Acidobacteriota bacterium]
MDIKKTLSLILGIILFGVALASCTESSSAKGATAPQTGSASGEPDYSGWTALLTKYYDPQGGMNYKALKAGDAGTLQALRQKMAGVNVGSLSKKEQLAYWINLYNINVVSVVVEHYPLKSIRDLSTDPIIRLNVFKTDRVPFGKGKIALNDIENDRIREGFKDPRIHFAINCAAKSCPPIRTEAYRGAKIDEQLDDQARKFLNGPHGARVEMKGNTAVVHVTKIMDWFGDDFEKWGGGKQAFLRRFLSGDNLAALKSAKTIRFDYDDYDWGLNDASK